MVESKRGLVLLLCIAFLGLTASLSAEPALELVRHEFGRLLHGREIIMGEVRNNSDREYRLVLVEFNLYDKDGAQVGTASDMIRNLEPHGTWRFEAKIFHEKAVKYKVKNLSGRLR